MIERAGKNIQVSGGTAKFDANGPGKIPEVAIEEDSTARPRRSA